MRVLVTGATGLVGRRLVKRLLDSGHETVAVSRNVGDAAVSLPVRCAIAGWRPEAGQLDASALEGVDAVVHLAGENVGDSAWSEPRKAAILRSRVDSTRALVGALAQLEPASRPSVLVSASAIGFYGDCGQEEVDETSAGGQGFLAEVCRQWEDEARRVETLGMRWVAARIGVVLARDGGAVGSMLPLFRLGLGGPVGGGAQWISWIHVDDLVSLLVAAIENPEIEGPVNAVAPAPVTNREFSHRLSRALGRPAILPVPGFALRAALGEMADLVLDGCKVKSAALEDSNFRFDYGDLDLALADICADLSKTIEQEVWIDRPVEDVFRFFSDPYNLESITPKFLGFSILSVSEGGLREGALIDYRLLLHHLPLRWRTRIEVWDPPRSFVDVQLRGPYRSWRHTHDFEPFEGGTLIRDVVRYELPLGALGELVGGRWVERDVALIFAYRRTRLLELFAAAPADEEIR